jgi:hypothetical protein
MKTITTTLTLNCVGKTDKTLLLLTYTVNAENVVLDAWYRLVPCPFCHYLLKNKA